MGHMLFIFYLQPLAQYLLYKKGSIQVSSTKLNSGEKFIVLLIKQENELDRIQILLLISLYPRGFGLIIIALTSNTES